MESLGSAGAGLTRWRTRDQGQGHGGHPCAVGGREERELGGRGEREGVEQLEGRSWGIAGRAGAAVEVVALAMTARGSGAEETLRAGWACLCDAARGGGPALGCFIFPCSLAVLIIYLVMFGLISLLFPLTYTI